MSTVSSDLSEEKVVNRREKQFIVDLLKNADEKKEKVKFISLCFLLVTFIYKFNLDKGWWSYA